MVQVDCRFGHGKQGTPREPPLKVAVLWGLCHSLKIRRAKPRRRATESGGNWASIDEKDSSRPAEPAANMLL